VIRKSLKTAVVVLPNVGLSIFLVLLGAFLTIIIAITVSITKYIMGNKESNKNGFFIRSFMPNNNVALC
jgi:uncharacterized membrane protein YvlD (DUF360 family)